MKCHNKTLMLAIFALAALVFTGGIAGFAGAEMQENASAAEEQESSPEYIEQYEAWEKAKNEPDLHKSAAMLMQFLLIFSYLRTTN